MANSALSICCRALETCKNNESAQCGKNKENFRGGGCAPLKTLFIGARGTMCSHCPTHFSVPSGAYESNPTHGDPTVLLYINVLLSLPKWQQQDSCRIALWRWRIWVEMHVQTGRRRGSLADDYRYLESCKHEKYRFFKMADFMTSHY